MHTHIIHYTQREGGLTHAGLGHSDSHQQRPAKEVKSELGKERAAWWGSRPRRRRPEGMSELAEGRQRWTMAKAKGRSGGGVRGLALQSATMLGWREWRWPEGYGSGHGLCAVEGGMISLQLCLIISHFTTDL